MEMKYELLSELGILAIYCAVAGFQTSHLSYLFWRTKDADKIISQAYQGQRYGVKTAGWVSGPAAG